MGLEYTRKVFLSLSEKAVTMDTTPQPNDIPQTPLQPLVIPETVPTQPRHKSRVFAKLLVVLLVVALLGSLAINGALMALVGLMGINESDGEGRIQERYFSHNRQGTEKIAILSIEGTILSGEGFFKQQIDHARKDIKDGNLKALVVRVNSPGGTITGSDYMLHHLRKLADETDVPVVVSMGSLAASGGYFVSMCVGDKPDTIFAEPTTWTGSIGVIIPHYNMAELMQKWGIQEDNVASHRLKGMGSIARKMTEEERKIFQELVDEGFTKFKDVIKQGRPKFQKDPAALDKLATGQVYTADQALKAGLVDKIGFIEEAIDRAILLAGLAKDDVKVVKYKAEPKLSDILFGQTRVQPSFDLAALLETTTPRAYYLCTWLPALAESAK